MTQAEALYELSRRNAATDVVPPATWDTHQPLLILNRESGDVWSNRKWVGESEQNIISARDILPVIAQGKSLKSLTHDSPSNDESKNSETVTDARQESVDWDTVIELARSRVSVEVADRLIELRNLPIEDDESALQVGSAYWFVQYCIRLGIRKRPLITASPMGEIGATWEHGEEEVVDIEFFDDEKIWVALKLEGKSVSFESTVRSFPSSNLLVMLPDWARA